MPPLLLDLFCGAGGCSEGYRRAGFEVVGVDSNSRLGRYYRGGTFICADALEYVRAHGRLYDAVHASPPCQAHSVLRALQRGREYPDLIPATRSALRATGRPYVIENVPGAPLGGGDSYLLLLCGTMFGLVTPDGRAEIRRHRLFETNWYPGLRLACRHGGPALTVAGHAHEVVTARRRKVLCVAGGKAMSGGMSGHTAQTNSKRNVLRETFSVDEARAAMGIDWMPMKHLSQAIPPVYTEWIGRRLIRELAEARIKALEEESA